MAVDVAIPRIGHEILVWSNLNHDVHLFNVGVIHASGCYSSAGAFLGCDYIITDVHLSAQAIYHRFYKLHSVKICFKNLLRIVLIELQVPSKQHH